MKRAQVALEYTIVMGFGVLIMIAYLTIVASIQNDVSAEATQAETDRIAGVIQSEIVLAAQVREGYHRTFELPDTIRGNVYSVTNTPGLVSVHTKGGSAVRRVPPYNGNVTSGTNFIEKENGVITVS